MNYKQEKTLIIIITIINTMLCRTMLSCLNVFYNSSFHIGEFLLLSIVPISGIAAYVAVVSDEQAEKEKQQLEEVERKRNN